jgi:hypothetical protein
MPVLWASVEASVDAVRADQKRVRYRIAKVTGAKRAALNNDIRLKREMSRDSGECGTTGLKKIKLNWAREVN